MYVNFSFKTGLVILYRSYMVRICFLLNRNFFIRLLFVILFNSILGTIGSTRQFGKCHRAKSTPFRIEWNFPWTAQFGYFLQFWKIHLVRPASINRNRFSKHNEIGVTTFERAVKRGVENCFHIIRTGCYFNFSRRFVPYFSPVLLKWF